MALDLVVSSSHLPLLRNYSKEEPPRVCRFFPGNFETIHYSPKKAQEDFRSESQTPAQVETVKAVKSKSLSLNTK
jgi:hypothetical protein